MNLLQFMSILNTKPDYYFFLLNYNQKDMKEMCWSMGGLKDHGQTQ